MTASWQIELRVTPSFDDGFAVCISNRPGHDECFLWIARGFWMELPSAAELQQAPATLIPQERGAAIYDLLHGVSVAAFPAFDCGLDGTTYTLSVASGFSSVSYKWWDQLPADWSGLGPAVESLTELASASVGA